MVRGIERRSIFADDRERWHFVDLLAVLTERYQVVVHAYVCMDSHYHLILQTPDANLSRAMHGFNVSYSAWYNARHQRCGPLFQRRFKSVWIENVAWAHELSVYVHLNPLRQITFTEVAEATEQACGESWESLRGHHGNPAKWLVLRLARRYTGMTLVELGTAAGGMDYAAVGMALKRLDRRLGGSPDLLHLEARIVTMLDVKT